MVITMIIDNEVNSIIDSLFIITKINRIYHKNLTIKKIIISYITV